MLITEESEREEPFGELADNLENSPDNLWLEFFFNLHKKLLCELRKVNYTAGSFFRRTAG